MKTTFTYPLLLLAVGGMITLIATVTCSSCTSATRITTALVIIHDITDTTQVQPQAATILPYFDLKNHPEHGADFAFSSVSDVSINPYTHFALVPAGNTFTTNPFDRKRAIKIFETDVATFLNHLPQDTIGRPYSSVYLSLVNALNRLSKNTATKRLLFVYSDLMENTPTLSFYNKQTLSQLENNPAHLQAVFDAQEPLAEYPGIEIHLVYQPHDATDDANFRVVSNYYKKLLEQHGATVIIEANLTNEYK